MPRVKVARVPRSIRLPEFLDGRLAVAAEKHGLSVNQAIEVAVSDWLANPTRSFAETFEVTVPTGSMIVNGVEMPMPAPLAVPIESVARVKRPDPVRRDVTPRFKAGK